jgi:hypothetical protein
MKRVGADEQALHFQLNERERDALVQILQSYPVLPPAHHAVSKQLPEAQVTEYQRLLDEALAEQRAANQMQLQAWLAAPGRFQQTKAWFAFSLDRGDVEWLLQVLNDIRVGNWLHLGSPDFSGEPPETMDPALLPAWAGMELSAYFQMNILDALEH